MNFFTIFLTWLLLNPAYTENNETTETVNKYRLEIPQSRRNHLPNWVIPQDIHSNYDISDWVSKLYLQQCAIVEIGEETCAVN